MVQKQRLSPEDWLNAGIDALSRLGPEGLKAEPLARTLQTTKGSFYWHFKDVPDFQRKVVGHWCDGASAMPELPGKKKEAIAELHDRMAEGLSDTGHPEAALRAWARTDEDVATALAKVDAIQLERITQLLDKVGVTNPDVPRALYAARIGIRQITEGRDKANRSAMRNIVDLVLALR
ncbi:TetR/AcrR family transcriptional regulator [Pseudooceanicola sp. 216_PA32_1]|uniref:TetR/AcrR family transcriptional regulator n=1 Tax=Pseudooceanicola pacificus TaxID=2676438 RepID=A0A844W031_9RHOB|nr:TetR/AcrR family transcriptional regulator [Pseudooceanicola pacificus]MWB76465.1 TetR/AcrR family transcriptional regulator [Pseudooceanicola pacificus]